jgi:tRNA threonylcarbamoyladenosine biosynthesis protein TsaB
MSTLLHIETATRVCSVALSQDSKLLALRESSEKNVHSSVITVFIDEVMEEAGLAYRELDAVAVSKGPGSYTGLRIGVSTAKGICFAQDKPLIAIGTLQALAWGARQALLRSRKPLKGDVLLCPMIDARRMEVYTAVFSLDLQELRETKAEIITSESFGDLLQTKQVWFTGDGAEKCRDFFKGNPQAHFMEQPMPSARYLIELAEARFKAGHFEDTAYFEPYYLKDFIPGVPKVKGLK